MTTTSAPTAISGPFSVHTIAAPTLVLSGEIDVIAPPRFGRAVAEAIPGAEFVVLRGEAHQPFQERPAEFTTRLDAFWRSVDADGLLSTGAGRAYEAPARP